jgi:hypothetical protein
MIVECPHCHAPVVILELNCAIFRHGVFKSTYEQIPPHLPKEDCAELVKQEKIFGCGKPFQIVNGVAVICDYI